MNKIKKAIHLLINDRSKFFTVLLLQFNFLFPDKIYLSLLFRCKLGYWMNWKKPKTFSEKIQWLKVNDRNPKYTIMVDKLSVKEYVAKIIGEEYIIPTLGVWEKPEDIDWGILPDQFVLKTTHDGGSCGIVICKNKQTFNKKLAIETLQRSYKRDIYKLLREWPYKNVSKRVIAELFMKESNPLKENTDLQDYKFYCFNGSPTYCQVIRDRNNNETIDFYDMDWNHMPFLGLNPVAQNGVNPVTKPNCLNTMIDICRKLSRNIPFSRIDLYLIDNKIYFGEITFYPASGMGKFVPSMWNEQLGKLIDFRY